MLRAHDKLNTKSGFEFPFLITSDKLLVVDKGLGMGKAIIKVFRKIVVQAFQKKEEEFIDYIVQEV